METPSAIEQIELYQPNELILPEIIMQVNQKRTTIWKTLRDTQSLKALS